MSEETSPTVIAATNIKQYALVPQADPVPIPPSSSIDDDVDIRKKLLGIYESYAAFYPNPDLATENQERDRLLRAVSAADHAVQLNPKKKKRKGLFGWFGSSSSQDEDPSSSAVSNDDDDDDRRLKYTDIGDDNQSDWLLGTEFTLDSSNIPDEAHAVARRQMSHHPTGRPNVARTYWESAGCTFVTIVDLGVVVEFASGQQSGEVQYTSDRNLLRDYYACEEENSSDTMYDAAQARACMIGPNLLIVSWGLRTDYFVVFYQRIAAAAAAASVQLEEPSVRWEAMAVFGPTPVVQENLGDLFLDEGEGGFNSLLCVTDMVPLVVEVPGHPPATTLVVSRLGGFLELVSLPPQLLYYRPDQAHSNKRRHKVKRKASEHYAAASKLPNLASTPGITALTTSDYHSDVIGLEVFRTSVDDSVEWDQAAYPQGPPAEHVVAAYGMQQESGHQVITFWSVSTILEEDSNQRIGFTLHANLSEALDLGKLGPDMTLFASPAILRHWRRPRQVELRVDTPFSAVEEEEVPPRPRVTTLSVSAPIVGIRFLVTKTNDCIRAVRAAVLDYNGGVTVLDCDWLEKVVAQRLTEDEYNFLHKGNNPDELVPLAKVVGDRSHIGPQLSSSDELLPPCAGSIQWFERDCSSADDLDNCGLAALVSRPCSLRMLFSPEFVDSSGSGAEGSPEPFLTTASCSGYQTGALHRFTSGTALYVALRSTATEQREDLLSFCVLQELRPSDIVQSLVRSAQFEEAIAAAESLSTEEQMSISDAIEDCKKKLWERKLELSALETMKDVAYIVSEALKDISEQEERVVQTEDVGLLRRVCYTALSRIKTARLGESLSFARSIDEMEDVAAKIRKRALRLGTYELLCQHLHCEPSATHFFESFLPVQIAEFAWNFAKAGDILPLSLLIFRHRSELLSQELAILDKIPVSVTPSLYQHILPVGKHEENTFMTGADADLHLPFAEMPGYLMREFDFSVTVDEEDEILVLKLNVAKPPCTFVASDLEEWYSNRALAIDRIVGDLESTAYFSELALSALGIELSHRDLKLLSEQSSIENLVRLMSFADTVYSVFRNDDDDKLLVTLATLGSDGFSRMDTDELVTLIMNCSAGSLGLDERYNQYLLPLVQEKIQVREDGDIFDLLDESLVRFCHGQYTNCNEGGAKELLGAAKLCEQIAWLSRTSLERSLRIIKDKRLLISLVLTSFDKTLEACDFVMTTASDERALIESFWKMYESLPTALTSDHNGNENLRNPPESMDSLQKLLVFLDIVSRWPSSNPFRLLREISLLLEESKGLNAVSFLCQSFCEQLRTEKGQSEGSSDAACLLGILLGDISDLNGLCFKKALPLKDLFSERIVKPLLALERIDLLGEFLSKADPSFVDSERMSREVLIFFNDAVYGKGNRGGSRNNFRAAMECQDLLGLWLPELTKEFEASRRYLDAAHHISTVLGRNEDFEFGPEIIRNKAPLEVVVSVLQENPHSLVQGCRDWEDEAWAKEANKAIRAHLKKTSRRSPDGLVPPSEPLPVLPGHAVYRLAQLLGLEDNLSVVLVKTKAIHFAVLAKLHGAAAAICRTLFGTTAPRRESKLLSEAVAAVITAQEYQDDSTKAELCSALLVRQPERLSVSEANLLSSILSVWNRIEHHDTGSIQNMSARNPMASMRHFFRDTQEEYSTELGGLFSTLHCQLTDSEVDDIQKLARYAVFWCISRSTRPKRSPLTSLDTSSTKVVVALAASLILHLLDANVARECLQEFEQIVGKQASLARSKSSPSTGSSWTRPDPGIVKRLIGRGYSECGSRRAAAMTNNVGFDEAMRWAVMHSLDNGFDDLLTGIMSTATGFYDEESTRVLERTLSQLEKIVSSHSLAPVIASLGIQSSRKSISALSENGIQNTAVEKESDLGSHFSNGTKGLLPERKKVSESNMTDSEPLAGRDMSTTQLPGTSNDNYGRNRSVQTPPSSQNNKLSKPGNGDYTEPAGGFVSESAPLPVVASDNCDERSPSLFSAPPLKADKSSPSGIAVSSPLPILATYTPDKQETLQNKPVPVPLDTVHLDEKSASLPAVAQPEESKLMVSERVEVNPQSSSVFRSVDLSDTKVSSQGKLSVPQKKETASKLKVPSRGKLKVPARATGTKLQASPSAASPSKTPTLVVRTRQAPSKKSSPVERTRHVEPPTRQRFEESPSSAPLPSPDRSVLLLVGQEAFKMAVKTASPRDAERQRLIQEGRELLQRARSSSAEPAQRYGPRAHGGPPTPPLPESRPNTTVSVSAPTPAPSASTTGPAVTPLSTIGAASAAASSKIAPTASKTAPVSASTPSLDDNDVVGENGSDDEWDFDEDDLDI